MVLREGTIAAFGPREDVLAAINGRAAEARSAAQVAPAPAPARPPAGSTPPVLVNQSAPAPVAAASPDSGLPPFNLKFND
jgi:ATP-binding cassette subfamily C exporter for protease/lipase